MPTGLEFSFDAHRHALVAPRIAHVFQELDVAVSLWEPGRPHSWHVLYERPLWNDVLCHELEHGAETERVAHNNRALAQARRTRKSVLAWNSGFADLFVPVRCGQRLDSVLVTGPFATERPSSAEVLERWRVLTGRQGHPADPEFAAYLATTLSVLLLEGGRAVRFQTLAERFAGLLRAEGDADALYRDVGALRDELIEARFVDRMWDATRSMVDERTSRIWASPNLKRVLGELGLSGLPEQAMVGFLVDRDQGSDPVDELLRRDALQRASVELARRAGNVACGKIGGHGIVLLCSARGSASRTRRYLIDLADRVSVLARRRFALTVHFGVSELSVPLSEQVQAALAAAESAVSQGVRLVHATAGQPTESPLAALQRELGTRLEEKPDALPARFDRYLEAVGARCGFRLDPARAYLEAGFVRVAESLRESGALDERSLAGLTSELDRTAADAATVNELFVAYRRALGDVAEAIAKPRAPAADRSLRRAEEYMRKHYAEALSLARVARVAGFSPTYFSELFRKRQGITFERHLVSLRIERAKQLLSGTGLNLERVARLSGLSTRTYLGRVFKRFAGETPMQYRRRVLEGLRVGNATRAEPAAMPKKRQHGS